MDKRINVDNAKSVVLLTAALVMTATWAVGATGWTRGINILTFVGLGTILMGLMLTRSILPGAVAHLFSLVIGIGWSFWVTSRLLPAYYTWPQRWQNLAIRLNAWYERAIEGGTSYDNLMFIFQMSVIVWVMGYLAIWFIFRSRKVWPAIVPGGLVLLINLYYAPRDITFWFILYMLVSLLLVVRFNLLSQETVWRAEGVFFRPDISFDFLRDGFIFSVLVIGFAWLTPPVVDTKSVEMLDEFQGSWRDLQNEWNRLFADLNYRDRITFDAFGSSLKLGGPRHLTEEPVMDVQVDGLGRYWRAVVYDYYSGDGWLTRDEDKSNLSPDEPLSLPAFEARAPVTQTYTFHRNGATVLYAMSNPVAVDRSARVSFNALSDEQISQTSYPTWGNHGEPWVEEITYIRSNATVDQGESYQVVSMASTAAIDQLRAAGADYPAWITNRYLQLPDSITERTHQLARDLTAPYDNNFDKAQAIERFLRSELAYNERLAAPPPGVDKVDYILFTAKEAYCDYYASSMIVMLRSLGIPARLAAGYARGTFNSELNAFNVRNRDAHSWVEVFFPQYGWIEFEPTAAQPNIIRANSAEGGSFASGAPLPNDRSTQEDLSSRPDGNIPIDDENIALGLPFVFDIPLLGTQVSLPRGLVNSSLTIIGLLIIAGLISGSLWWRQQGQAKSGEPVVNLYRRMVRFAGWMGLAIRPWQTPYEHGAILQRALPAGQQEIEAITNDYVYQTFSGAKNGDVPPRSPQYGTTQSYNSSAAWNRLRPVMLKATIQRRLPRWLKNLKK